MEVDVVFMWVDGADPKHNEKILKYIENKKSVADKKTRTRFDQVNEIEYAVKSVIKYAPFIRNIFIVTDSQVPDFLLKEKSTNEFSNVKVIDHKEIFRGYEQYLPTFNSRSIATMLYRIPNLAEHFVIFCDDFLLLKKVDVSDFFIKGEPYLRGEWKAYDENIWYKKIKNQVLRFFRKEKNNNAGHFKAQQIIAKKLGFKKFYRLHHVPMPMRKSTFESFFTNNPDDFINNIRYRFRHSSQFLLESLINHLEIKNKSAVLTNNYQLIYFQNYKKPFLWIKYKLLFKTEKKEKLFLCMQSLDQTPKNKLGFIIEWLEKKYRLD